MKNLLVFLCLSIGSFDSIQSQVEFYVGNYDGRIAEVYTDNCVLINKGSYPTFYDIAITPNGYLYGSDGMNLHRIDLVNQTTTIIGPIVDQFNNPMTGTGLVGLNNGYLLGDFGQELIRISTTTAIAEVVGYIGFFSGGDFAFFQDTLYMASIENRLFQIVLDTTSMTISAVNNQGLMNTVYQTVFGLFTSHIGCDSLALYAMDGNYIYKVNTANAAVSLACIADSTYIIWGAASIHDFASPSGPPTEIPNVFTPNNDGLNDDFQLINPPDNGNFSFVVYSRWGNKIFETNDPVFQWNGSNLEGNILNEGVYFYRIHYGIPCENEEVDTTGTITVFK